MKEEKIVLVTTADNPFDPFTQFNSWYHWDVDRMGYNTLSELARLSPTSENLTDGENESIMIDAINTLLNRGWVIGSSGQLGIYIPAIEGQTHALC
jgi:hypothetical protein